MKKISLVILRKDLRLDDNEALWLAREKSDLSIPVFIWDENERKEWSAGAASKVWLHHSLKSFSSELQEIGLKLIVRRGEIVKSTLELANETKANRVYVASDYEPSLIAKNEALNRACENNGIEFVLCRPNLICQARDLQTQQAKPFQVYTPFWKAFQKKKSPIEVYAKLEKLPGPARWPNSCSIEQLELLPKIKWDKDMISHWKPGVNGARENFKSFTQSAIQTYKTERDFPSKIATSRLSPHFHFGEISPRRLWLHLTKKGTKSGPDKEQFLKEIFWREFGYHLLFHFDQLPTQPMREEFEKFPWRDNSEFLERWQKGQTGYPLVDAGMRELYATGWMHNRIRMVVASFLVKHLRIHWLEGAKWFWDTLVDADLASNTLGWQWAAGCGPDAAPYFRIFNPIIQSKKFDTEGEYIRKWVPELQPLNSKQIHTPWECDTSVLEKLDIKLGKNYPKPIVDHKTAREEALAAYEKIKGKK